MSVSGHTLPLWVGVDEHLFERQGLNPHVLYIEGSVIATAALLSGDLDIIQETPAASVRAQLKGGLGMYEQQPLERWQTEIG